MIKAFFKYNFFLIFAIAFAIPVVIVGVFFFQNIGYANIARNGIETTGYIIPDSYYSNLSINDVNYYHVKYYFYDQNGNECYGRTSDAYLYYDVLDLEEIGTIKIKYDPKSLDSIEATFDLFKDGSTIVFIIILAVFGTVDVVFWVISIKTFLNNLALIKVEKYGTEYNAVVSHIHSNLKVNGVHKFKVYYSWTNEMGQTCSGASQSKYYFDQAKALEDIKNIRIRAIGNKSYIVTDPDTAYVNYENSTNDHIDYSYENSTQDIIEQNNGEVIERQEYCDYCGEKVSSSDSFCPNCGVKRH